MNSLFFNYQLLVFVIANRNNNLNFSDIHVLCMTNLFEDQLPFKVTYDGTDNDD